MLDCYFLDISPLLNGGILVNSLTVLPKDRTMNVLSYGSPGDRARSAGSGMLIEYVRNEYGVKGRLKVDRFGKPSFSGGPPFSIARSGSYTIIAVSDEPVGVDLARSSSLDAGTFPFMFTGEELSIINGSGRWRRVAACRMWTGKESYLKALGKNLSLDPGSFEIAKPHRSGFVMERPGWTIHELKAPKGYCASVCASPTAGTPSVKNLFLSDDGMSLF
ncbi:4'-phosphopantetheinyl transferase family protein [Methanomethylophilus alvi]|uniref:4'-phosphopantetheinyl transferase family protein n=1 Tax=Methanomethylophilus alvi TaxID=1291540 RepID=UPI0037DD3733